MIIDFQNIEEKVIENFRGGEKSLALRAYADADNKIMMGRLEPGASVGLHKHVGNSEIVYVISGSGKAVYNGETMRLEAGMCHYCPQDCEHTVINDGTEEIVIFAVVPEHK